MTLSISERVLKIRDRIEKVCAETGRRGQDVALVAVTKTVSPERVLESLQAGIMHIGENRVQEAQAKFPMLADQHNVTRHMIGHLQRNKAGQAAELFDMVQSVDSLKLAQALDRRAAELNKILDCLLEIKVSDEPAKTGIAPEEAPALLESCRSLKRLNVKGLMCVAPYCENPEQARPYFRKMRELRETLLKGQGILSMGMSHDFEAALREGSTMVRIGTAIFGERTTL